MKKKDILFHLGNVLIITSIVGFLYIFYPIIQLYLFPTTDALKVKIQKESFSISIPKIHAYASIIQDVDPWKPKVYNEALKKGVAHAKGSSLPGERGTMYLFAHSTGNPWEINRFNTVFFRLNELSLKDIIYISYKNKQYRFSVVDKKEVWPSETKYLENLNKNQLILQTCTPIGTSIKRLLVFAEPE